MQKRSTPLVSIGLPVFNGERYIDATIESIRKQTFSDFELIISDNASTDGTSAICQSHAARDGRVRYYRQTRNIGGAANYDRVLELAGGKYFKWAAHDDLLAPAFIEECVVALERDASAVLAYPGTVIIDESANPVSCHLDRLAIDSDDPVTRFRYWVVQRNRRYCNPIFGVMRRATLTETGSHGHYISSDFVFLATLALYGRCHRVRGGLFLRRLHDKRSVASNPGDLDRLAWYLGQRPRRLSFRYWRLLRGLIEAVSDAPISARDKLRATGAVLSWSLIFWRRLGIELLLPLYVNGRYTRLGEWLLRAPREQSQP